MNAVKIIRFIHMKLGYMGEQRVEIIPPPFPLYSHAYACPHCGEIWFRRVQFIEGKEELRWTFDPSPCSSCDEEGGQIMRGGGELDFTNPEDLPFEVLRYEFEREMKLWKK